METIIFYNETTLNGKFQVMANIEITGKGIKKVGSDRIAEYGTEIYKNLNKYWVNSKALENLKLNSNLKRTCF